MEIQTDTVYAEANLIGWQTFEGAPPPDLPIMLRTEDPAEARAFLRGHDPKDFVCGQDGAEYLFCRRLAPQDRASWRGEP